MLVTAALAEAAGEPLQGALEADGATQSGDGAPLQNAPQLQRCSAPGAAQVCRRLQVVKASDDCAWTQYCFEGPRTSTQYMSVGMTGVHHLQIQLQQSQECRETLDALDLSLSCADPTLCQATTGAAHL